MMGVEIGVVRRQKQILRARYAKVVERKHSAQVREVSPVGSGMQQYLSLLQYSQEKSVGFRM